MRLVVVLFALLAAASAHAIEFALATVDEGRAIVAARDEYIERLGDLERALKTKSAEPVTEQRYLEIVAQAVQPWTDGERAAVTEALERIRPALVELQLPLPPRVVLVRSSGLGEGGAPHTRGSAIIVTDGAFELPARLPYLLAHELFHVASRHDRRWRNAMYATIGFAVIEEVTLPPALAVRRITNPDAPRLDVAVGVGAAGQRIWVTPVLQATVDRYDAARGGEFFAALQLRWLQVGAGEAAPIRATIGEPPRLLQTRELVGFAEKVGRNTAYVIHPEEILADNFAQLVNSEAPVSPEVHERLRAALRTNAPAR